MKSDVKTLFPTRLYSANGMSQAKAIMARSRRQTQHISVDHSRKADPSSKPSPSTNKKTAEADNQTEGRDRSGTFIQPDGGVYVTEKDDIGKKTHRVVSPSPDPDKSSTGDKDNKDVKTNSSPPNKESRGSISPTDESVKQTSSRENSVVSNGKPLTRPRRVSRTKRQSEGDDTLDLSVGKGDVNSDENKTENSESPSDRTRRSTSAESVKSSNASDQEYTPISSTRSSPVFGQVKSSPHPSDNSRNQSPKRPNSPRTATISDGGKHSHPSHSSKPVSSRALPHQIPRWHDLTARPGLGKRSETEPIMTSRRVRGMTSGVPPVPGAVIDDETGDIGSDTLEGIATNFLGRVTQAEEENRRLLMDNDRLIGHMKVSGEQERQMSAQVTLLRGENADLREHNRSLSDENDETRRHLAEVRANIKEEREAWENEKKAFLAQVSGLEDVLVTKGKEVNDLQEDRQDLTKQLQQKEKDESELKKTENDMNEENVRLRGQCSQLEEDLNTLQAEYKQLTEDHQGLQQQVDEEESKRQGDASQLTEELEKTKDSLKQLSAEFNKERSRNSELQSLVDTKDKDHGERKDNVLELKQEVERLKVLKQKTDDSAAMARTDYIQLKGVMEVKERDIIDLKKKMVSLEGKSNDSRVALLSMGDLVKAKQNHIDDLQKEITDLRNANSSYIKHIDRLETLQTDKEVDSSKYDDIMGAHKKLLGENARLKTQLAHKAMREANVEAETTELHAKLEKEMTLRQRYEVRVVKLEGWMDEIYHNQELQLGGVTSDALSTRSLPDLPSPSPSPRGPKLGSLSNRRGYLYQHNSRQKKSTWS